MVNMFIFVFNSFECRKYAHIILSSVWVFCCRVFYYLRIYQCRIYQAWYWLLLHIHPLLIKSLLLKFSYMSIYRERGVERNKNSFNNSGPPIFQLKSCQWFHHLTYKFVKEVNLVSIVILAFKIYLSSRDFCHFSISCQKLLLIWPIFLGSALFLLMMGSFDEYFMLTCPGNMLLQPI